MEQSGIYQIFNISNKKRYIGSSKNIGKRISSHKSYLKKGAHPNSHLQNAWVKNGGQHFVFSVIEICCEEILINREQHYINAIKPEYNIRQIAHSNLGIKTKQKTKELLSKKLKGVKKPKRTKEHAEKIAMKLRGRKTPKDVCIKISSSLKGRIKSEQHMISISKSLSVSMRGKKLSDHAYAQLSLKNRGCNNHKSKKVINEETGQKWDSLKNCSLDIGISVNNLSRYLRGARKNDIYKNFRFVISEH